MTGVLDQPKTLSVNHRVFYRGADEPRVRYTHSVELSHLRHRSYSERMALHPNARAHDPHQDGRLALLPLSFHSQ